MKTRISSRDWETLSTYLDGQLSEKERARLEARLKEIPDLRQALEEMKGIRLMLRSLPKMRAPRNYTLTPQMVATRRPRPSTYPVFRLAFVLSTILLAITFLGDFFIPRILPLGSPLMAERSEQPSIAMLEVAPEAYDEPPAEAPAAPAEEEGALRIMEIEGEPELSEVPPEMTFEEDERPIDPESDQPDVLSADETGEIPPPEPAVPLDPHTTPAPDMAEDQKYSTPGEVIHTLEPPGERGEDITERALFFSGGWTVVRTIQVALALIAVSAGFAALYVRRKTGP